MTHSHHLVPRLGITLMIGASALTHTLAAPDRESFALEKRPIEGVPVTAFDIPEGFQIEVWAQSPMVFSPVAMDCDAAGRLFLHRLQGRERCRVTCRIQPGEPRTARSHGVSS